MATLYKQVHSVITLVLGLYQAISRSITPFAASGVDVTIPLTPPQGAPSVAPDLVSLSIEQDRWDLWAGTTEPNEFFYNALDNLVQITNSPPFVRIGADSEDHTDFSYNVKYKEAVYPCRSHRTPYPEAIKIVAGQGFYDIISHLPAGTRVQWGVNLRDYNLTALYLETKALVRTFGSPEVKGKNITLNFIEVGNEADLYGNNRGRGCGWDIEEYVHEWIEFATNVSVTAGLSETSVTKLIGGAFAGSSHKETGFSPQSLFAHGILKSQPGAFITAISQHKYSGTYCGGPGATCHGVPGVSNTAGAALWALDYSLSATQGGISRLHFHQGIGSTYNFIQPATLNYSILNGSRIPPAAPHIQPPYYAAIIAAEAIGATGSTQVSELDVGSTDISGYAIFERGKLVRAVFINLVAYLSGGGTRGLTHIDMHLADVESAAQMDVKRLDVSYANATHGVTWGGQTYETPDARVNGTLQVETVNVAAGLDIKDTEAVLLTFKY